MHHEQLNFQLSDNPLKVPDKCGFSCQKFILRNINIHTKVLFRRMLLAFS